MYNIITAAEAHEDTLLFKGIGDISYIFEQISKCALAGYFVCYFPKSLLNGGQIDLLIRNNYDVNIIQENIIRVSWELNDNDSDDI